MNRTSTSTFSDFSTVFSKSIKSAILFFIVMKTVDEFVNLTLLKYYMYTVRPQYKRSFYLFSQDSINGLTIYSEPTYYIGIPKCIFENCKELEHPVSHTLHEVGNVLLST